MLGSSNSRLDGREFDSAASTTGMGDRLRAGKPPQYFTMPPRTGNEY